MKRKFLWLLCILLFFGAMVCGLMFFRELAPRIEAEELYGEIRAQVFSGENSAGEGQGADGAVVCSPDWETLARLNPDICGWIYGPGTSIDYPVVQGADNDFYLSRTVDRKPSIVGAIFLESRNSRDFTDDVSVLYGHHIRGGRLFSSLSGYKDQSYYRKHPTLYLYLPGETFQIRLFAGKVMSGDRDHFPLSFKDHEERETWLDGLIASSTFQSGLRPSEEDRILVLCTCSYEYHNARYALFGIMTKLDTENMEEAAP